MPKLILSDGKTLFSKMVDDIRATVDFSSVTTGSGATSNNITVPGAMLGDFVFVAPLIDTQGLQLFGWVTAANSVKIRVVNNTGADVDLVSAQYNIKVVRG
ncbi:hypothetical protein [Paenibacillus amylolyticus]|uniref:hypothetical protein n=1 Tax=Paenibacillus amylolyticus TaxID=1451 RepID=UPI00096C90C0|nr:hypothetical protein [Paenibacillus amylolyticus]OMF47708.1 hypothetical protein BK136_02115 [Paenibacillus amylolyticus]